MQDFKEDLRVKRTRVLLSNSLMTLLETTPFENITIVDICNKSMVHRATFYNHFRDKTDLLNYAIDEIQEDLFNSTVEKESYNTTKDMYMDLISKTIDFIKEKRETLLLVLKNNDIEKITGLLMTTIKRSIRYLMSKNKYKEKYLIPVNLLLDFFSGGIANIGLNWLQSSNPCSKEELMKYFDIMLNDNFYIKQNDTL